MVESNHKLSSFHGYSQMSVICSAIINSTRGGVVSESLALLSSLRDEGQGAPILSATNGISSTTTLTNGHPKWWARSFDDNVQRDALQSCRDRQKSMK